MRKIMVAIHGSEGREVLEAQLNETNIAGELLEELPVTGSINFWGDEIYSEVPLDLENENPETVLEVGDLAYWPEGNSVCIFYGPTPTSGGEEPEAASPVTKIGEIVSGLGKLKNLDQGEMKKITVEKKED